MSPRDSYADNVGCGADRSACQLWCFAIIAFRRSFSWERVSRFGSLTDTPMSQREAARSRAHPASSQETRREWDWERFGGMALIYVLSCSGSAVTAFD